MDEAWIKEAMRLADACMSLYGDYRILVERYGVSADAISSARNAYLGAESDLEAHLRSKMKGEPAHPTIPEGMALVETGSEAAFDKELADTAMRFVDRAGDVHPGIDDADRICAEFHKAMSAVVFKYRPLPCRKCGSAMKPGIATGQTFNTSDEGTCSPAGPGKLIDCMKCESCGWSVSASKEGGNANQA